MRTPELPALTGIRFYAALFVFLSHVTIIPGMARLSGEAVAFNAGVVGVSFFFVLSGFILTFNYASVFRGGVNVATYKRFVWNRLTRLYPVHFATLLLVLPIAILSPNLPFDWRAIPFHLLLLQCFWPFARADLGSSLNVPSWSISCEWFFYLVAPAAMYLTLSGVWRRTLLLAATAAYAGGIAMVLWASQSDHLRLVGVSWFAPFRFPEFLVGVLLARHYLGRHAPRSVAASALMQSAGLVLLVAGAVCRPTAPWPLWGGLLYVPGAVLLVSGLADGRGWLAEHLARPWLRRLGTASYSLYLVHAPILRGVKGLFLRLGWEVHSWAAFAAVTVTMFLLVQAVALVMYRHYELPVQNWLRGRTKGRVRLAPI